MLQKFLEILTLPQGLASSDSPTFVAATVQTAKYSPSGATAVLNFYGFNKSLADDGTTTLSAVTTNGIGAVCIDSASLKYTFFVVDATGTVTLISNSASVVANADTDTNLCIGTAVTQEPLTIKNRLGGVKVVNILFWYD